MQKHICMVYLIMMIAVLSLIRKDRGMSSEREKCKRESGSVTISLEKLVSLAQEDGLACFLCLIPRTFQRHPSMAFRTCLCRKID